MTGRELVELLQPHLDKIILIDDNCEGYNEVKDIEIIKAQKDRNKFYENVEGVEMVTLETIKDNL